MERLVVQRLSASRIELGDRVQTLRQFKVILYYTLGKGMNAHLFSFMACLQNIWNPLAMNDSPSAMIDLNN